MTAITSRFAACLIAVIMALLFVVLVINDKTAPSGSQTTAMSCPIRAGHCVTYDGP